MAEREKDKKAGALNAMFSIFDSELRRMASRLAAAIPEDSPLRSELAVRSFDALRGAAEGWEIKNPLLRTLVEKASDFGDKFAAELSEAREDGEAGKKPAEKKAPNFTDKFVGAFIQEAKKRILSKPTLAEMQAEAEKITAEFEVMLATLRKMEESVSGPPPKAEEPKKTRRQDPFRGLARDARKGLKQFRAWRAERRIP